MLWMFQSQCVPWNTNNASSWPLVMVLERAQPRCQALKRAELGDKCGFGVTSPNICGTSNRPKHEFNDCVSCLTSSILVGTGRVCPSGNSIAIPFLPWALNRTDIHPVAQGGLSVKPFNRTKYGLNDRGNFEILEGYKGLFNLCKSYRMGDDRFENGMEGILVVKKRKNGGILTTWFVTLQLNEKLIERLINGLWIWQICWEWL